MLKEEIRRYERNSQRDSHLGLVASPVSSPTASPDSAIARNEYLKNIVVKFLQLPSSATGERSSLVPVLATLLALSPEERDILTKIATSGSFSKEPLDATSSGQNWSAYLASWTSLG